MKPFFKLKKTVSLFFIALYLFGALHSNIVYFYHQIYHHITEALEPAHYHHHDDGNGHTHNTVLDIALQLLKHDDNRDQKNITLLAEVPEILDHINFSIGIYLIKPEKKSTTGRFLAVHLNGINIEPLLPPPEKIS